MRHSWTQTAPYTPRREEELQTPSHLLLGPKSKATKNTKQVMAEEAGNPHATLHWAAQENYCQAAGTQTSTFPVLVMHTLHCKPRLWPALIDLWPLKDVDTKFPRSHHICSHPRLAVSPVQLWHSGEHTYRTAPDQAAVLEQPRRRCELLHLSTWVGRWECRLRQVPVFLPREYFLTILGLDTSHIPAHTPYKES